MFSLYKHSIPALENLTVFPIQTQYSSPRKSHCFSLSKHSTPDHSKSGKSHCFSYTNRTFHTIVALVNLFFSLSKKHSRPGKPHCFFSIQTKHSIPFQPWIISLLFHIQTQHSSPGKPHWFSLFKHSIQPFQPCKILLFFPM